MGRRRFENEKKGKTEGRNVFAEKEASGRKERNMNELSDDGMMYVGLRMKGKKNRRKESG